VFSNASILSYDEEYRVTCWENIAILSKTVIEHEYLNSTLRRSHVAHQKRPIITESYFRTG
jgi:hypothetical protein